MAMKEQLQWNKNDEIGMATACSCCSHLQLHMLLATLTALLTFHYIRHHNTLQDCSHPQSGGKGREKLCFEM